MHELEITAQFSAVKSIGMQCVTARHYTSISTALKCEYIAK